MTTSPALAELPLPKELQLLCKGTLFALTETGAEALVKAAQEEVNWQILLEAAQWHRLGPALFASLSKLCPQALPTEVMTALEHGFRANVSHNMLLTATLVMVLKAFQTQQVRVLPFKGIALAAQAYPNMGFRKSRDLDLLIEPSDFDRALNICVNELGFQLETPLQDFPRTMLLKTDKEVKLRSPTGILLELHWRLAQIPEMYPLNLSDLDECQAQVPLGNLKLATLPFEELFTYLCFHGTRHLWFRLFWVADLVALLHRYPEINWARLGQTAKNLHQTRTMALGLKLAQQAFGITLPPEAIHQFPQIRENARELEEWGKMMAQASETGSPYYIHISQFKTFQWEMRMHQSLGNKAAIFYRSLLQPNAADLKWIRLPRFLYVLYFF